MFNINNVIKEKTVHIGEQEIIRTNIGKNETRGLPWWRSG